jgi:hypothetical protein
MKFGVDSKTTASCAPALRARAAQAPARPVPNSVKSKVYDNVEVIYHDERHTRGENPRGRHAGSATAAEAAPKSSKRNGQVHLGDVVEHQRLERRRRRPD